MRRTLSFVHVMVACMTFLFISNLNAQLTEIPGKRVTTYDSAPELHAQFKEFDVYSIDAPTFRNFVKESGNNIPFQFKFGKKYTWTVSMTPYDLREENFAPKVATENGIITLPKTENILYRGYTPDGGPVSLTVDNELIYGFLTVGNEEYYIEPVWYFVKGAPKNLYVVYAASKVQPVEGLTCGATEAQKWGESIPEEESHTDEETAERSMGCYIVNVKLAADWEMVNKFGSATAVIGHVLGILGNVATNYDNEFNHQLVVVGGSPWVSGCSSCDPWTSSNDAGALLSSFTGWGNSGGFGTSSYTVAGLWTARNLGGSTIGIAWLNGICNSSRYHVCQDFSGNANLLRVVQAHELGHNFSANHDASGSPFIMAPAVNNTSQWSSTSVSDIDSYVQFKISQGCFTSCGPVDPPPVPNFTSDITNPICVGDAVTFMDLSLNNPTSWSWSFPGGTPSTSNAQNPTVIYNTIGIYNVTLTVTNAAGSNTITIPAYVRVENVPIPNFTFMTNLNVVQFTNSTFNADSYFWDFDDGGTSTQVNPTHTFTDDGVYFVTLTAFNDCGPATFTAAVSIVTPPTANFTANPRQGCTGMSVHFNNLSTSNSVNYQWSFPGGVPATSNLRNPVVVYPAPGLFPVTLIARNSLFADTLTIPAFVSVGSTPIASFVDTVNIDTAFFYNSTIGWDSLFWDFGDGTTTDTIEIHPVHIYDHDGEFDVMLIAINECGPDTIRKKVIISTTPIAGLEASQTSGCADFTTTFQNLSSQNSDNFAWSFPGGNPATSTLENPTVTYSSRGEYDVTLIAFNANGSDTITMLDYISVEDMPTADYDTGVNGSTATFTNLSQHADSYRWDFGDGNTSTQTNPVHQYAVDGVYTVVLSVTNECGTVETSESITIATPPQAGLSADVTSGCNPLDIQFNNQSSQNSTSYQWSFPGGSPSSSTNENPVVTYNNAGTFDVQLIVTNSVGSDTLEFADYVFISTTPTADYSPMVDFEVVTFENLSSGADSYSWNFGDGETSDVENPVHSYAADGVYEVILTATNNCGTEEFSQFITIVTLPTAGLSASSTSGCEPFSVSYSNQSSTNAVTFEWSFPGGTPSVSSEENPTVVYNNPGLFDVELIVTNPAGEDTLFFEDYINVGTTPTVGFTSDIDFDFVSFTNTSSGAISYHWDFGDGETSNEANPEHTFAADGVYTVTLFAANVCGVVEHEESITIVTPPSAGFQVNQTSGCSPFEVTFENLSSSNSVNYEWDFAGGSPSTSTDENPTVIYDSPGTYSVTLKVFNSAGSDTIEFVDYIEVGIAPTVGFDFNVDMLEVQFNNQSSLANSYVWDFGDGTTSTEENPTHVYAEDDIYNVTLTVQNECGEVSQNETVIIATVLPVAFFHVDEKAGCAPFEVHFENQSSANSMSFEWEFPGGNPSSSTDENPVVTYNAPGVYDVKLIAVNFAGQDTSVLSSYITVGEEPVADFDAVLNQTTVTFTNNSVSGVSYEWDFGDGMTSSEENTAHTFSGNGTYEIALIATNECGTDTMTQEITIQGQVPVASFTSDIRRFCAPGMIDFTDQSAGNPTIWQWQFPGGSPASSNEQNPTVEYDTTGIYAVTLDVTNIFGSHSVTQTAYIIAEDDPIASFTYQANGFTVDFTNMSSGGNSYAWDFGDGNTTTDQSPSHTYTESGHYEVVLRVTNSCGTTEYREDINLEPSGIDDLKFLESLLIFPNPSKGSFTLLLKGQPENSIEIGLGSMLGQQLYEEELSFGSGELRRTYDFDHWSKGVYILRITSGNQSVFRKVVIE